MKANYRIAPPTLMEKFNCISNRLAQERRNICLNEAIISWCIELSLEKHFPQISREIIHNKDEWIQNSIVQNKALILYRSLLVETDKRATGGFGNAPPLRKLENISTTNFYYNITETKNKMSIKSVVFVAFLLTGIGLLLYLLNRKDNTTNTKPRVDRNNNYSYTPPTPEKQILALLIKSDRYQELIHSLQSKPHLQAEDSSKLYGATQGLWIGAKSKFNRSQIKQKLANNNPVTTTSEYDVNFITLELDKDDSRFHPDVNAMDRRDAFKELAQHSPKIVVSPRLSCKAYENTEFYNR